MDETQQSPPPIESSPSPHRTGRARKMAIGLGALLATLVVLAGTAYGWSVHTVESRAARTWDVAVPEVSIPSDPEAMARGEHLVRHVAGCVECHGDDLGGRTFVDDPALGTVMGANLTRGRGGVGGELDDEDLVRAILHGVGADGRSLRIMPTEDYAQLSARDLGALIAYVRSVPPVDRETSIELRPLAYVLTAQGVLPLLSAETVSHEVTLPPHVDPARTVEYGEYLARLCTGCHGSEWEGQREMPGAPPGTPPIPSLRRAGLTGWGEADFERALRHGQKPGGIALHDFMPWEIYAGMTDDEVAAIWMFLQTLE